MAAGHPGTVLRILRSLVVPPGTSALSDAQLLRRFAVCQEEAAFTALVHRHGGLVWGVCRHVLRHEQDAEDAFQATFLVLARKADSIRSGAALAGFLHGTAYRVALRARRDAAIRRANERRGQRMPAEKSLPEAVLVEALALVDEEVERLPERERAAFVLRCLEGKSQAETARLLGWKEGTVSGTLARARQQLRRRLTRRGVTLSGVLAALALGRDTQAAAVPAGLPGATVRAALGHAAAPGVAAPSTAVALADAVSRALSLTRLRTATVLLLALGLATVGTMLLGPASAPLPGAAGPAATPEPTAQPRTDRSGDPLPEGALARLGTTRFRHGYRIYSLAVSRDGRRLVSRGLDSAIRVWDPATARELNALRLPTGCGGGQWNENVVFTPDGKQLIGAVGGGWSVDTLTVWDVATGQDVRRFPVQDGRVTVVAVSPDGRTLAAATSPPGLPGQKAAAWGRVRLWDARGGAELRTLEGHRGEIEQLAFAPDGRLLASAARDRTVRLWDPATGREVRRLEGKLVLAPDIELPGVPVRSQRGVVGMAFAPDGKTLAVAASDPTFRLWDVATGKELPPPPGDRCEVTALAFVPGGRTILSGGWDGLVRVWDLAGGKEPRQFRAQQGPILSLALFPDGNTLAVSGLRSVRLWDLARGTELRPLGPHHTGIHRVAFSPDGNAVATGSGYGEQAICLWDAATGRELHRLDAPPGDIDLLTFAADGKTLTVGAGWQATARVWDRATGRELPSRTYGTARFFSSPDGRVVAGSDGRGNLVFWDAATGKELHRLRAPGWSGAALGPDNQLVADTPEHDGTLILWDARTGRELRRFHGYPRTLASIAVSPDGKHLAAAFNSDRASIVLWDTATGANLGECPGNSYSFAPLVFSPDGKTLASGERSGSVRLWEVATCRERRCFSGHLGSVLSLAFSLDGNRLVSGGDDTLGVVWDVHGLSEAGRAGPDDFPALWADLASGDAAAGGRALGKLVGAREQGLAFLSERLRPAPRATPERLARVVADLDSESFAVRRRAARELEELGEVAEPALRRALASGPSAEVRRRAEGLLQKLPLTASSERLRQYRAIEVLEALATPDARRLLETLQTGAPEALLTREARAAADRLAHRPAPTP
jgi:RNA polymerase sigma factor (sigma-70 family)